MAVDDAKRARRRALLKAHLDAENAGDMNAVMATFAAGAAMHYNAIPLGHRNSVVLEGDEHADRSLSVAAAAIAMGATESI